jgi:hypothetical protein
MHNFPHQVSNLHKLHAALEAFSQLARRGTNLADDGVVGVAMARAGVYTFREKGASLRRLLSMEAEKPRGMQGTRTFARELRRFFLQMGFLRRNLDDTLEITEVGRHVQTLAPDSDEGHQIWRTALRSLALIYDGNTVHPYLALMRLVRQRPGIEAARLALALESNDDSEEEFQRILGLADRPDWHAVLLELGVSEHKARDATKILPALGRQIGDLRNEGARYFPGPAASRAEFNPALAVRHPRARIRRRVVALGGRQRNRRVTAETIARAPNFDNRPPDEQDLSDPAVTAEVRRERLERHERIVRSVARLLSGAGFDLSEDPYDILADNPGRPSLLLEIKTLDGSLPDEIAQVRSALGQLLYYEVFHVPAHFKTSGLVRIAVFETPISEDHYSFLESFGIIVAWLNPDDSINGPPLSRKTLGESGLL